VIMRRKLSAPLLVFIVLFGAAALCYGQRWNMSRHDGVMGYMGWPGTPQFGVVRISGHEYVYACCQGGVTLTHAAHCACLPQPKIVKPRVKFSSIDELDKMLADLKKIKASLQQTNDALDAIDGLQVVPMKPKPAEADPLRNSKGP
jgi:hypothetical protein